MYDVDVLVVLVFIIALVYFKLIQRPPNFPPGPIGIPILGNLLQLGETPFLKFQNEWKQKYGPIIGVDFGSIRTVAISDYRMIKEAMTMDGLSGRPALEMWKIRSRDIKPRGIMFTEGQENSEMRKITLRSMRKFGPGVKSFENVVTSEILAFLDILEKSEGKGFTLKNKFHIHILNILWQIVAGRGCEEDRQRLNTIYINATQIVEKHNFLSAIFMFVPWISKYFPSLSGYEQANSQLGSLWEFLQRHIDEHKREKEETPGVFNDFIGDFLNEIQKNGSNPFLQKHAGENNLMTSLLDLFFAGTDTVGNTLGWAHLILALNPDIQEKFVTEIAQIVGNSRLPELSDEANMPYTQALIQEILRFTSVAPMGVFHTALSDVQFHEFKIPKDSMVLVNLHGAHHDKDYWGDPENIRPERWLSEDGKSLRKHEAFIPFGMGKRVCVGETLARNELFLFLTSIFQRFQVTMDPSVSNPTLEPVVSFLLMPPNHPLNFQKRNEYYE